MNENEISDEIKENCIKYSRDHLTGVWNKVTSDNIVVKPISGGSTNKLYHCLLSSDTKPIGDEPNQVVILLYGNKQFNNNICDHNNRLSDAIIATLTAQKKLSSKVYALFESGQIIHYYKHKHFNPDHQKEPMLVKELAIKLAKIHGLDVPIRKTTTNWLSNTLDIYYNTAYELFPINQLIEECNCETLNNNDIKREIEWVKQLLIQTNSAVVFCHNDFRGANIMVIDGEDNEPKHENCNNEGNRIKICDFEYACYGYRGYDFGHIFSEWNRDVYNRNALQSLQQFPCDELLTSFIDEYISESVDIVGQSFIDDERNSRESLLKEIKIFCVIDNLWTTLVMLKMNRSDLFPKLSFMLYAESFYKNYFHLKKHFIEQNVISL